MHTPARPHPALSLALVLSLAVPATAQTADRGPFAGASRPIPIAPGVVSSELGEYSPTYDVERGELIFMRRTPGLFDYTLFAARWDGAQWSQPTVLPFSGEHRDGGPYLAPGGASLVFDSRRPVEGLAPDSIHIWRVERAGDGWGVPQLVRAASQDPPGEVGAGADEFGPLLDGQGNLYFYSFRTPLRAGSHYVVPADDPHRARRETDLPDPSAATFVGYATLSADGRTAVIEGRARGRSDTDLFVATRGADGTWSAARPLEAVNTTAGEGTPYLTSDGRTLLFGSTRSGASDLYAIELCAALGG